MNAPVVTLEPTRESISVRWKPEIEVLFRELWNHDTPVPEIAKRLGWSPAMVYNRARMTPGCKKRPRGRRRILGEPAPTSTKPKRHIHPGNTTLRRFGARKAVPEAVMPLKPDSAAMRDRRTVFPATVVSARDTPRILVSGHNNPKIGTEVRNGPWSGMPIYMVTLEERATCPRSCWLFASCYGNAMHMARRHEHGPLFERRLAMELGLKGFEHPQGFVVRLHVLGDFYSVEYVRFWERMLATIPELRVWGYTANDATSEDEAERAIAREIQRLRWSNDRFAIRWSRRAPTPGGTTVIDYVPEAPRVPEGIVCPAQTEATACCSTCGLCWSPAARSETIVFIKHGRVPRGAREEAEKVDDDAQQDL